MNSKTAHKGHGFEADLESYLSIEGVMAAALVSTDGLVVSAAGDRSIDLEALAVHSSAALSSAKGLARDAGISSPRFISVDLIEKAVVLAPLNKDLFLILTGNRRILSLPSESSIFL